MGMIAGSSLNQSSGVIQIRSNGYFANYGTFTSRGSVVGRGAFSTLGTFVPFYDLTINGQSDLASSTFSNSLTIAGGSAT